MTATPGAPAERRRPDRADLVVGLGSVAAFVSLVRLGRGLTFFADEWAVIEDRPIGIETFFRPFNEHWLGVTTLVHRAMVETIGLGTYVPYLALLAALHVVVALLVYAVARRLTLAPVAAGIAVVVLFFGSGFENLFWGMQIGFLGAIALGLGALLLLEGTPGRGRVAAAVALLVVAVATSGYGLFLLGFVVLDVLLDPRRRRLVAPLFVPAGTWLTWYVAVGRSGVATHGDPFTLDQALSIPGFIVRGAGAAFGGATGVGPLLGIVVAGGVVAWLVALAVQRGTIPPRALAAIGAIVAMYGLLALVRSQLEEVEATQYTRYTYLSGILALVALAAVVGRPTVAVAGRERLLAVGGFGAVLALSLVWNGALLVSGRELFAERADLTRALIELGLERPLPDGVDPELSLVLVPSPNALPGIIERFGSPLADSLAGDAVRPIPDDAREEALRRAQNPPEWLLEQQAMAYWARLTGQSVARIQSFEVDEDNVRTCHGFGHELCGEARAREDEQAGTGRVCASGKKIAGSFQLSKVAHGSEPGTTLRFADRQHGRSLGSGIPAEGDDIDLEPGP